MKKIIVALTGASGSILAYKVVEQLLEAGHEVHFIASTQGEKVMAYELERDYGDILSDFKENKRFIVHANDQLFAPIASGSYPVDAMCIVPCSMGTMGKIAHGIADSLICRAADVTLKERRHLVLVVRETPLSSIHLENMLTLSRCGVSIVPPVPAYYNRPKTADEIATQSAARILKTLGIDSHNHVIWEGTMGDLHE